MPARPTAPVRAPIIVTISTLTTSSPIPRFATTKTCWTSQPGVQSRCRACGDASGAWSGFASCAVWLSWRTGLAPGAAREHVRVAQALERLPKLSAAMRRGRVSYSKVRAVTRVATPETEPALLDVALAGTAALLRAYGSESDDSATGQAC